MRLSCSGVPGLLNESVLHAFLHVPTCWVLHGCGYTLIMNYRAGTLILTFPIVGFDGLLQGHYSVVPCPNGDIELAGGARFYAEFA